VTFWVCVVARIQRSCEWKLNLLACVPSQDGYGHLTVIIFVPSRKTCVNIRQRFVKLLLENLKKDSNLQKACMRGEYGMS
jgi:hypothetical protein